MTSPKRQKGVALITVLLIVSLAAIVVTEMSGRLQLQLQRTANISMNTQAYWYALGAEQFAKQVLIESFRSQKDKTTLDQIWAQGENSFPVDYGQITAELVDMQGCFNLNNIIKTPVTVTPGAPPPAPVTPPSGSTKLPMRAGLERLIEKLEIDGISSFEAEYMVDALKDWIDKDGMISGSGGAEDDDYSGREFSHLAGNTYLASVNELRIIEHFTLPVLNELRKYVCVIPDVGGTKININTLSEAATLAAILDISEEDASDIISEVPDEGYNKVEDFFNSTKMKAAKPTLKQEEKDMFGVDSEYFQLKTIAEFNENYFAIQSIMKVDNNKDISVIGRSVGFLNE